MASDFAIAQFRFLTPLLLVHGRLSYKRITRMILFFFYKNLLFGTTIFIYNAFALFRSVLLLGGWLVQCFGLARFCKSNLTPHSPHPHPTPTSGQPIYNDFYMTMFNVVFTATAPLVVGWFDRDLDRGYGEKFPLLYREGTGGWCAAWQSDLHLPRQNPPPPQETNTHPTPVIHRSA